MFFSFEEVLESVKLPLPEFLVIGQPFLGRPKRGGVESHNLKAAAPLARDQFSGFQYLQVLGHGGQRNTIRLSNFADRFFLARDVPQNRPARRVGECVKDRVQPGSIRFNHMVESYADAIALSTNRLNAVQELDLGVRRLDSAVFVPAREAAWHPQYSLHRRHPPPQRQPCSEAWLRLSYPAWMPAHAQPPC
jgi:hypothetical protein